MIGLFCTLLYAKDPSKIKIRYDSRTVVNPWIEISYVFPRWCDIYRFNFFVFSNFFFLFQRKMADLAKFWNEIKGLPKEERSEKIQEEYGNNPEILEILKEILANKDDNHENLENTLLKWRIMNQV